MFKEARLGMPVYQRTPFGVVQTANVAKQRETNHAEGPRSLLMQTCLKQIRKNATAKGAPALQQTFPPAHMDMGVSPHGVPPKKGVLKEGKPKGNFVAM